MIEFVRIDIGGADLPRCRLCEGVPSAERSPTSDVVTAIADACGAWHAGPGPNVALTGGDALVREDLEALVAAARRGRAERVKVTTGGAGLDQPTLPFEALLERITHVEAVLLGGPAAHDDIAGVGGQGRQTMARLAALTKAADASGCPLTVLGRVPVCRHNLPHAAEGVAVLASLGAVIVTLDVARSAATSVHARPHLAAAVESGVVNGAWVQLECITAAELAIDALHDTHALVTTERS